MSQPMASSSPAARRSIRNPMLRVGLPMICSVLVGTLALAQFAQGKRDLFAARDAETNALAKDVVKKKTKVDLQEELARLKNSGTFRDNYELKKVPGK
ncbi:hypothetical protein NFJ02_19g34020 [Pycnococcus provasolii]